MVAPDMRPPCVQDIVTGSTGKNQALAITGGLIFTGQHFAQVLEGPSRNVDVLMQSIGRDQRHTDIKIVAQFAIEARRFPKWTLAYAGSSRFVSGHITRLISSADSPGPDGRASWLVELMAEFVAD